MTLRRRSISGKLTRMNMLVCAIALVIACVSFSVYERYTIRQAVVTNLSSQAALIGANTVSAITFNDPEAAHSTLSALRTVPYVTSAGIFTPDGKLFAQYTRDQKEPFVSLPALADNENETYTFGGNHVVLVRKIIFQNKTLGSVYVERNLDVINLRLQRYFTIALVVLIVSLVVGFVVSARVSKSVSDPVVRLAEVASSVTRQRDYSVRAAPTNSNDELALLINSFNAMLQEIQRRDLELQTSRDQLEVKVDERTRQLVAANRELEAFAYSVSHDLRAPLETINGFSHVLRTALSARLADSERVYLEHIQQATKRMAELIDDLLNLSRVSTSEIHKVKVDLAEIARDAAVELCARESERVVHFDVGECEPAEGDPRLLQLAVENLLSNAWKYTSSRADAVIEFGCKQDHDRIIYFVRDNGAGFDPRLANRLFKPFQRLHTAAEFPGTGIGLATVYRIVQRHGGEIWAEGAVGKGATFFFTLSPRTGAAGGQKTA